MRLICCNGILLQRKRVSAFYIEKNMTLQSIIALIFTIIISIGFIAIIILLGWFLIWKAFLSKFRLVRELLGQEVDDHHHHQPRGGIGDHNQQEQQQQPQAEKAKARKLRKE